MYASVRRENWYFRGTTLEDTGCCGVIVKQKFILDTQYTGLYGLMQVLDNTVRRVPMATVHVVSPNLTVEVSALCPLDAVYDVVVGNVPGTRQQTTTILSGIWPT